MAGARTAEPDLTSERGRSVYPLCLVERRLMILRNLPPPGGLKRGSLFSFLFRMGGRMEIATGGVRKITWLAGRRNDRRELGSSVG